MAKYELKFVDIQQENLTIQTNINGNEIEITSKYKGVIRTSIFLDKSTAIKFAKTLRTEINKITEQEGGQNGSR